MREIGYCLVGAILGCVLGPVVVVVGLWFLSFIISGGTVSEGDVIGFLFLCVVGGAWVGGVIGLRLARGYWPWWTWKP
jgi:hypothetical protein